MSSKSILLIEDEPIYLEGHINALEDFGYHVDISENAFEAEERLRKFPHPSLIILDIIMPFSDEQIGEDNGMKTGIQSLEKIRGELNFSGPIIILTVIANEEEHDKIHRIEKKFHHEAIIKVKPILPSELIEEIDIQLNQ